ncbi:malate dehydrogenase, mitochondrial [Asbolus verrucosus]|uniref:Malate dehydrogenase, mitochondrial n=1 Tax=Asbolus verrucosus TaxID=1661398 RepID=A0A482W9W3_ASBVE|nr:malate dehydrogenase, mitochondrial [Asbolus verrucosus]
MTSFRSFLQICRHVSTKPTKRFVQVCVIGADTPGGQMTALLLKQNPAISALHLQGTSRVESMGVDLSHFDTRCKVESYYDMDSVAKSVKCADIVLMMGLNTSENKMTLAKRVMAEGPRVVKLAESCAKYAPKAIIVVAVSPVSVMLPIVAEVYRKTDWYHPGRLLGSVAITQIKANAMAGQYQNLDPQMVHVPIVGGPDLDCAIPLFSQTVPAGMSQKDSEKLLQQFRAEIPNPIMSQAYGLNRMITGIALGLNGDDAANVPAFVRSNIISTCCHMVATVKIGRGGVIHNYGLQKLYKYELAMFEEMCLQLKLREEMASDLVHRKDKCTLPAFMIKEIEEEKTAKLGIIR